MDIAVLRVMNLISNMDARVDTRVDADRWRDGMMDSYILPCWSIYDIYKIRGKDEEMEWWIHISRHAEAFMIFIKSDATVKWH